MSNWEKTMKEWDDSVPDGIKFLSAENRVLTRKVRELESENDALQARAERAEAMIERLIEAGRMMKQPETIEEFHRGRRDYNALVAKWKEQK